MASPEITGYKILETLGTGGFASVYLASQDGVEERVAIKVLHAHTSNASDLRRFEREANTMRAFNGHPNIVQVFDSGETPDGAHYTVLELVDGGSVQEVLRDQGAMQWTEVIRIAVQICSALDIAHRSGVLHRDVKPGNVLVDGDAVKLSDFGIARLVGQSQVTAAQSIIGTLAYTPPEIFHNDPFDGRGDIYQLGVTMYEMLLGRAPFTSAAAENKAAIIRRIIDKPAPPLAQFDIPQPLSDFLDEVLAKDPADRPQTAEGFAERLNEIERELGRTPTEMHKESPPTPAGIKTIQAPTMPMSMNFDNTGESNGSALQDPTIDSSSRSIDSATSDPNDSISGDRVTADNNATDSVTDASVSSDGDSSDGAWPAAASIPVVGVAASKASTPTPPVVRPPNNADLTVAEPRPDVHTSILANPEESVPEASARFAKERVEQGRQPPDEDLAQKSPPQEQANTPPRVTTPEESSRGRGPWLLLLLAFIVVAGAGIFFALTQLDNSAADDAAGQLEDENPTPGEGEETPDTETGTDVAEPAEFAAVETDVFAEPASEAGIVFGSVANSSGLTMVGGVGDSDLLGDQRSVIWTLGEDGFAMQRDIAESGPHRMWSIGVNQDTFLAVGATSGPDGLAWTGGQASSFAEVVNSDFTGPADDRLRAAVFDTANSPNFLVGGSRSEESTAIAQIWEVSPDPSWEEPTWTRADLGGDVPGVINDIAVGEEFAVGVGRSSIDGEDASLVLIRRDAGWAPLISPLANVEFWGVTIVDDQIFIVGEENTNAADGSTPIAVVANSTGEGLSYRLPIRDEALGGTDVTGIARAIDVLDDGTVLAIGDVGRGEDPEDDRGGAIWEYLPEDESWTTRASTDLLANGFAELWTLDQYQGQTYIFGRTETEDGRRIAGAWTLAQ